MDEKMNIYLCCKQAYACEEAWRQKAAVTLLF